MLRSIILTAVIMGCYAASLSGQNNSSSTCDYVVKEVAFEVPTGLTPVQIRSLRKIVVGMCYDPADPSPIGKVVYDRMRNWGYDKATVDDPYSFRILDHDVQPRPIALMIYLAADYRTGR